MVPTTQMNYKFVYNFRCEPPETDDRLVNFIHAFEFSIINAIIDDIDARTRLTVNK